MITGFSQGGTVRDNVGSSTSSPPPQTSQHPAEPANHDPLPVVTDAPELSEEQKRVFKRIMGGESIFFTGSAGVGKSVLTRAVIRALREKYPDRNQVAVTATTGIAATNIGGCTLHSWAGLGLAKMSVDKLFYSLVRSKMKMDVVQRWKDCKVLIIDEGEKLFARLDGHLASTKAAAV